MDKKEYNEVKEMDYEEFYNYLVSKYHHPEYNYAPSTYPLLESASSKERIEARRNKGLLIHHYYEYMCPELELAVYKSSVRYPLEYQYKEYLCFCDLLEHLYLHILIAEKLEKEDPLNKKRYMWIAGDEIIHNQNIIPLLDDVYTGRFKDSNIFVTTVGKDKDVYLLLLARYKAIDDTYGGHKGEWYASTSYNKKNKRETKWTTKDGSEFYREVREYLTIPHK